MSVRAMAWAMQQQTGSPTRKLVLLALADRHNNDTGQCNPRIEKLADDTELGQSTVRRALVELVERGLLGRARSRRKDGSLREYHYTFPLDPVLAAGAPPPGASGSPPPGASGQEPEVDLEPGATTSTEVVAASGREVPPAVFIDGRNVAYDALAEVCSIRPDSPRVASIPAALNGTHSKPGIRALAWREIVQRGGRLAGPEAVEAAIADLIRERAAEYRARFDDVELTPTALLKWWVDLPYLPGRQGRAPDALAGARAAAEELRRIK